MKLSEESATIARIKAHDLGNSLENKFEVITSNLELMAHSRSIQDNDLESAECRDVICTVAIIH
jgi:hypothetical protein